MACGETWKKMRPRSLRNMLLKATFPSSYLGLVEATSAAKKKWVLFGTAYYKFMSAKNIPLSQQYIIYSTPFRRAVHACSLSKRCDHASQKQAQTAQCLQTPSNCRHFHHNLYQTRLPGCSAFPESRLQSLPHPYSPITASDFFRISRNPV